MKSIRSQLLKLWQKTCFVDFLHRNSYKNASSGVRHFGWIERTTVGNFLKHNKISRGTHPAHLYHQRGPHIEAIFYLLLQSRRPSFEPLQWFIVRTILSGSVWICRNLSREHISSTCRPSLCFRPNTPVVVIVEPYCFFVVAGLSPYVLFVEFSINVVLSIVIVVSISLMLWYFDTVGTTCVWTNEQVECGHPKFKCACLCAGTQFDYLTGCWCIAVQQLSPSRWKLSFSLSCSVSLTLDIPKGCRSRKAVNW